MPMCCLLCIRGCQGVMWGKPWFWWEAKSLFWHIGKKPCFDRLVKPPKCWWVGKEPQSGTIFRFCSTCPPLWQGSLRYFQVTWETFKFPPPWWCRPTCCYCAQRWCSAALCSYALWLLMMSSVHQPSVVGHIGYVRHVGFVSICFKKYSKRKICLKVSSLIYSPKKLWPCSVSNFSVRKCEVFFLQPPSKQTLTFDFTWMRFTDRKFSLSPIIQHRWKWKSRSRQMVNFFW